MSVTLRYWAAAKEAAGLAEESFSGVGTLAELLVAAARPGDPRLTQVLARCSFLVDEAPVGLRPHSSILLSEGAVVEALPPFAGG